MRYKSFQLFLIMAVAVLFSCSDPALIGSELLQEDQANLQFTSDIPIQAKSFNGEALQTYSPFAALQLSRHLFGNYEDPLMGITEASIYTQIALGAQSPPNFTIRSFDSIVLSLAYDTLGGYGNIEEEYGLEVYQLTEDLSNIADYFSDQTFTTNDTAIGSLNFIPTFNQRVSIREYTTNKVDGDTLSADPHVRVHLDPDALTPIFGDTSIYGGNVAFQDVFKGIHIRPTTATNAGLLSFDFSNTISRISLYYKVGGEFHEFQLDFNAGNARILSFAKNQEGAFIEPFLSGNSDSLLFLQGMAGANTEITFPNLEGLENIVVNKAELELTLASIDGNNTTLYPPTQQLVASQLNNVDKEILPDVRSALFANAPIRTEVFGGIPVIEIENGVTLTKYKINISGYFQQIIEGTSVNGFNLSSGVEQNSFYFQLPPKPSDPSRVVFYGPNHPTHPLKLNLTYTKL
ncbi:MAG: DUF4270 family protein [Saprospiraceae bacterium]